MERSQFSLFFLLVVSLGSWYVPAVAQVRDARSHDYSAALSKTALSGIIIGRADAPVTIVEYSSMTCGHCAKFHRTVIPELIKRYVDTGRARLISRDFALNNIDAAAILLIGCASPGNKYPLKKSLFQNQSKLLGYGNDPAAELFKIARRFGFSQGKFTACLKDHETLNKVQLSGSYSRKRLDITGTPTVFVNGRMMVRGINSKLFLRGSKLVRGKWKPGANGTPIYLTDNSLQGISRAIERAK